LNDIFMPSDAATEKIIIASMILIPDTVLGSIQSLRGDDFYSSTNRIVFEAIAELFNKGVPVDQHTVMSKIEAEGKMESFEVLDILDSRSSVDLSWHCKTIAEKSQLRKLITESNKIIAMAAEPDCVPKEVIESAQSAIMDIDSRSDKKPFYSSNEVLKETLAEIEMISKGIKTGITTGITDLDTLTSGYQDGDLIIIAGRPGMGKTALAICNAIALSKAKKTGLFVSLEMPNRQLMMRTLCREAKIPMSTVRSGLMPRSSYTKLSSPVSDISEFPLYFSDVPNTTLSDILYKALMLKKQAKRLDYLMIDYLQLIKAVEGFSREEKVSNISKGLKVIAKMLDIPVIALSQLSRALESREDKHPQLSDLRESGAIEQDADMIIFPFRPCKYDKEADHCLAEIEVAKYRNGPTGIVQCHFTENLMSFEDKLQESEENESCQRF
jgi:replicative DNA helicase